MMDVVIKMAVVCLVAAVLAGVLKRNSPEMALLLVITVVTVALFFLIDRLSEIISLMHAILEESGLPGAWFTPLFKAVPLALISRLGAELCRDASQNAMATLVEMTGAIGVLIVILPLFRAAWELLCAL